MFSSKIPIFLFFIICILAVTYLLYKVRAKITNVEGLTANPLVNIDAGGSDQYSPIRGSNPEACEQACLTLKNCPAYVMDYRTDGGVPRNNCWLKHNGIYDNNMYYAPGVTTYNLRARLNCPINYNGALLPPKSDPSGGNIVLGDWDVAQIKNIHTNVKATSGDNIGKTFDVSDNDMMEYIRISVKELNVPYELIGNTTVESVKIDGSGGKCPPPPTKKWMFKNYSTSVQSYVNNSILNYAQFKQFATLNKIAAFKTIEGLSTVTSTNVTNNLVAIAKSAGFTIEQTTDMSFNKQIENYIKGANSSATSLFTRLVKLGIKSNTDYNNLLTEMESGIGFVKSEGATWFVDILPQHGVKSPEKMKLFRDNMANGLYKNFGFVKPYYPAVQYQGPSVYFWYLDQLAKLGVGVDEFEGFSTIHKSVFGVTPNSGSKMDLNSGSWEMTKLFPTDPFLPLVPIYTNMGFTYRTSNEMNKCKTNFNTFCTTVNNFKTHFLINKLKMFSNRMKEYGMSTFLDYVDFISYLTETVGDVNDLVATMNTYKDYIKNTSGLTLPADNNFITGTVEIYGDANGDVSIPTKTTVEIFDYQIAKWFINTKLIQNFQTIEGNQNIYGVSPGISFTSYITDIRAQNMNYNKVIKPIMHMKANYKEYEVRSRTMANKTYTSIPYDVKTDPSKMKINGFANMESDSLIDKLGDWVMSIFPSSSSSSSEKEGLTDNTASDKETLSRFGVNDANTQLPQILNIFKNKYNVVDDFNEMIFYISCLLRVGVSRIELSGCIELMNKYKITKKYLDVFTQYMKNLGFTTWSKLSTFMEETYRFGINISTETNKMDYKQFIYMMRKWGCNFKSEADINLLYAFIWMCNDYLKLKYSHKVSNSTKQVSRDIVEGNPNKIQEWKQMVDNIQYFKRDKTIDEMAEKDNLIYSVSIIDNFIENMIGRGYSFRHLGIVFSKIIIPMYLLNEHPNSKNAYKTYPDLFFYINTKNPPYPPLNNTKTEMNMEQYLMTSLVNYPGNITKIIQQMEMPNNNNNNNNNNNQNKYISDFIIEFSKDLVHLQWEYSKEQMNKFDIPIKIENMVSFVYNDEYNSIMNPLSSEYSKLFGTDDKIIAYMMDMVLGMRNWLEEVKNTKPFDNIKYNSIIPTLNVIILHPIFMFRWMEQQIKANVPMCTPEAKAKHQNQNQCYSTIPTSQMSRKRNSYIDPPVKGNPNA